MTCPPQLPVPNLPVLIWSPSDESCMEIVASCRPGVNWRICSLHHLLHNSWLKFHRGFFQLLKQINNQGGVFKKTLKWLRLCLCWSRHILNLSKHGHGEGMHICDLLNVWSMWFSPAPSPVLSAAAGDRPAAGRAADGEEAAAQAHTEVAGSAAGEQTDGQAQTHQQAKGIMQ